MCLSERGGDKSEWMGDRNNNNNKKKEDIYYKKKKKIPEPAFIFDL